MTSLIIHRRLYTHGILRNTWLFVFEHVFFMFVSDLLNLSHFRRLWRVEGQPWAEMWYWSSSTTSSMGAWHRQVLNLGFKYWDRTGMYEHIELHGYQHGSTKPHQDFPMVLEVGWQIPSSGNMMKRIGKSALKWFLIMKELFLWWLKTCLSQSSVWLMDWGLWAIH